MRRLRYAALPMLALATVAQAQTVTQRENAPPAVAATTTTSTDGKSQTLTVPLVATIQAPGSAASSPTVASQGSSTSGQTGTLSEGAVVTGNQNYTVGTTQPLNLTPTGRLKVGVSAATNIAPAANLTTTLESDLVGCIYRATPPTWSDGWTGAISCNSTGSLNVVNTAPVSVLQGTTPWIVSGQSADGATPANPAIHIAGTDSGGLKRTLRTDTTGNLQVGGKVGIDQTTQGVTNGVAVVGSTTFGPTQGVTLAANGVSTLPGNYQDLGSATVINGTALNVSVFSPTAGTLYILAANNSAGTNAVRVDMRTLTAGQPYTGSYPLFLRYYSVEFDNGTTAQASNTTTLTSISVGK